MIKFEKVTKIYQGNKTGANKTCALEDVSFGVKEKEFISLVGKSGAGKTTLFRLLMGEERPDSGRILFDSVDVQKIKKSNLPYLRRRVGTVFQDYKLLNSKTAYENIAYALEVIGASDEEIKKNVNEVLNIVGLPDKGNNFPMELSGGEKQRVAIARALIHRPEVILADEPTGNLDPYNSSDIIQLLLKINELGTTVILATHNKDVVNNLGKRVITMEEGRLVRDEANGRFII